MNRHLASASVSPALAGQLCPRHGSMALWDSHQKGGNSFTKALADELPRDGSLTKLLEARMKNGRFNFSWRRG